MKTQQITFAIDTSRKETARIGKGSLYQPRPNFAGGSIKWFDDSILCRKHA